MAIELWDCQERDVNFAFDSVGTPIHASPCGSGKTYIQCEIARREMERGNYTALLTPRIELFRQTHGVASAICGAHNIAELRAARKETTHQSASIAVPVYSSSRYE